MSTKCEFRNRSALALGVAGWLAALGLAGPAIAQTNGTASGTNAGIKTPARLEDLFGDAVIARGKGVEIKRSQLDTQMLNLRTAAAANGQTIPPDQLSLFEPRELQTLIGFQLVLNQATEADRAKGREQFEKYLKKLKENAKLSDSEFDDKLTLQLRMQGLTREQWNQRGVEQFVNNAVLERVLKVNITDGDVKKYYDEHPSRFEEPEMVRVSQILLTTSDPATGRPLPEDQKQAKHKHMEDLLKRARAGEDFAALARENSDVLTAKSDSGEVRPFARGMMPDTPEFEIAAFSLTNNQVSDIITTIYGYHIIKFKERIPAKKVELASVADDVTDFLRQQEMAKSAPDYVRKLQQEADVQILDEKLKPPPDTFGIPDAAAKPGPANPPEAAEKK